MLNVLSNVDGMLVVGFDKNSTKLTIANADTLKRELIQLFEEGNKYVILNFSNLEFIDSTGFGSLIMVYNFANDSYSKLILCGFSQETMELVKITKLDQVFEVYPDTGMAKSSII